MVRRLTASALLVPRELKHKNRDLQLSRRKLWVSRASRGVQASGKVIGALDLAL